MKTTRNCVVTMSIDQVDRAHLVIGRIKSLSEVVACSMRASVSTPTDNQVGHVMSVVDEYADELKAIIDAVYQTREPIQSVGR